MGEYLEIVEFPVEEDVQAFLGRRPAAIAALRGAFPGLLDARLARFGDGTWVDVARWRSRQEAEAAAAGMRQVAEAASWAGLIAGVTSMRHAARMRRCDGMASRGFDALIADAQGGDRAALEAVCAAVRPPVFSFCRRLLGDRFDAEDAVQETLVVVSRRIATYRGGGSFVGWVYSIAGRVAAAGLPGL